MKPGDWYVCLHVRDAEFYGEYQGFGQTHRNSNCQTYLAAIRYITEQGGWVIKMGGKKSSKMPKMSRVINYAASKFKSEFMDLHLIRHARFFIGTTSGLTNVAISFNLPCALVNCITTDAQLWSSKVRFVFKSIVSQKGESLSQAQITSTPWRWRVFNAEILRRYDFYIMDNTSDEILETVKEIDSLAKGELSGYQKNYPEYNMLLARWQKCLDFPEFYGLAVPSLHYLKKHEQTYLADPQLT